VHIRYGFSAQVILPPGIQGARTFGWLWMDPLAGVIGALVIANWSYGLLRDTGAILLDINPDRRMAENVRHAIEDRGDAIVDLHVWRVGPGHMSAVVSVATNEPQRDSRFYHAVLERFKGLSHVTVEVQPSHAGA
jgi:Co/Zn/Cd efflux system component